MSRHPPATAIQGLFHASTPFSSVGDSNDEVDRLLAVPLTPECSLANYTDVDESDLSPLTSSDEEAENINTTPRPIKGGRTSQPRDTKSLTSTVERATLSPEATNPLRPPSPVDRPSLAHKKRKRTESSGDTTSSTAQGKKPKPGPYVSQDACHQCRNKPRYAFMRCTSNDESADRPCRKLFCASCVTKRYTTIDFNPRLKTWKCPYCKGVCNCTKCCSKRRVQYTSTSNVIIDHDTLLHYAALMPTNSKLTKVPPPPTSSKPTKDPKLAKRSDPKPARHPTKSKLSVKKNPEPARDVESIARGLQDTAEMFETFGCVSGEYWGVVFSNDNAVRIGVAYVGDRPPDIFILRDKEDGGPFDESSPPP